MIRNDGKIIAVDFDGTIVEHAYPAIGREMLFAFDTLKALQNKGHKLILWTFREGDTLEEAVEYCKQKGIEFYAVNKSFPEEKHDLSVSRKISADIFIDDRNVGGFPGWSKIWQTLHPDGNEFNHIYEDEKAHRNYRSKNSSFFKRLFGK
ncbi:MAG TPA: hydrolase [Bacteroidia bacterium]